MPSHAHGQEVRGAVCCCVQRSRPQRHACRHGEETVVEWLSSKSRTLFSADCACLFVCLRAQADEAYCIGPPPSSESYLRQDRIMEVAKATGAQVCDT